MQHQTEDNTHFNAIIELSSIDSTNNYALSLLRAPNMTERQKTVQHGTAVFAHEQWAGKGQRGKIWQTQAGENIQLSVIINPKGLQIQQQFILSALTAVVARNFFEKYAQTDITIKWPNDIYFQDRKAGGILIENIITGSHWKWAVTGIGLNINQTHFDPALPNPVSLKQITGKNFDCLQLAQELRTAILKKWGIILAGAINDIVEEYNNHLYKRHQKVKLKKDSRVFEAVIKNVTASGQLIVEHAIEERFNFGELVWLV